VKIKKVHLSEDFTVLYKQLTDKALNGIIIINKVKARYWLLNYSQFWKSEYLWNL